MTPKKATAKRRKKPGPKKGQKRAKYTQREGVRTRHADGSATVVVGRQTLAVLDDLENLSGWTDEELIAGRKHNGKHGAGRALPKIVPIRVHQELVSRVTTRAKHRFAAELDYAVKKHIQIIKMIDPEDPTPTQLKAIEMLYERILGKPTEHVALYNGGEMPAWQKAVAAGIVGSVGEGPDDDIVDGEIVEESG